MLGLPAWEFPTVHLSSSYIDELARTILNYQHLNLPKIPKARAGIL